MRGSSLVDEVRTKKSSKTLPEAEAVKEYPKGKVGAPSKSSIWWWVDVIHRHSVWLDILEKGVGSSYGISLFCRYCFARDFPFVCMRI